MDVLRVDFTDFRIDAEKARQHFGETFADIQLANYKKNSRYPIYEIQFHTIKDLDRVFNENIEYNGQRIYLQKGITNDMILQNVRVRDVTVDDISVEATKDILKKWFSQFGEVLEIKNNDNQEEKTSFWRCPDSNFHLQISLPKNFWETEKEIPNSICIFDEMCQIDWYGRNYFCYYCKKEWHIKRKCPNKGKRTRFNELKINSIVVNTKEVLNNEIQNTNISKEIHLNPTKNSVLIVNSYETAYETHGIATNIATDNVEKRATVNNVIKNVAENEFEPVTERCKGLTEKGIGCTNPLEELIKTTINSVDYTENKLQRILVPFRNVNWIFGQAFVMPIIKNFKNKKKIPKKNKKKISNKQKNFKN